MAVLRRVSETKKVQVELTAPYTVFGRADTCDIMIENDDQLSREHCGFRRYEDGSFTVVDFGSRNGTFVNDARIFEETRLHHGDRVLLGTRAEFSFLDEEELTKRRQEYNREKAGLPAETGDKDAGEDDKEAEKAPRKGSKLTQAIGDVEHELENKSYDTLMKEIVESTRPSSTSKDDGDEVDAKKGDVNNEYW